MLQHNDYSLRPLRKYTHTSWSVSPKLTQAYTRMLLEIIARMRQEYTESTQKLHKSREEKRCYTEPTSDYTHYAEA